MGDLLPGVRTAKDPRKENGPLAVGGAGRGFESVSGFFILADCGSFDLCEGVFGV